MSDVEETVREVLDAEHGAVSDHMAGDDGAMNYLVGKVMAETGGAVDPGEAQSAIGDVMREDAPEWPVTFEVYRRPVDKTTIGERLASVLPAWADRPGDFSDPTRYEFGFEVTVTRQGGVEIRVIDDDG